MIKALFFDIDGTLVSFQTHRLQDSTIQAFAEARRKGIKLFIATGRQLHAIDNLGTEVFDGYVTLNGSLCYASNDQIIYRNPIPDEDIRSLIDFMRVHPFPCGFVEADRISMNYTNEITERLYAQINFPQQPVRPLEEILDKTVYQLIAFFTKEEEPEIMPSLPHCTAPRWSPAFADVVVKGSDKGLGVQKILEHFQIDPSEAMTFGDGGNDIPMFKDVAVGVAMGNAVDSVKQAADYVTTSVDEDGVYRALKHFHVI